MLVRSFFLHLFHSPPFPVFSSSFTLRILQTERSKVQQVTVFSALSLAVPAFFTLQEQDLMLLNILVKLFSLLLVGVAR